jgi:hypothetical protein
MTTIERDAIGVAATGLIINTTAACVQCGIAALQMVVGLTLCSSSSHNH